MHQRDRDIAGLHRADPLIRLQGDLTASSLARVSVRTPDWTLVGALYADMKKAPSWSTTVRLQLPWVVQSSEGAKQKFMTDSDLAQFLANDTSMSRAFQKDEGNVAGPVRPWWGVPQQVPSGSIVSWAEESCRLVEQDWFYPAKPRLDDDYAMKANPVVVRRIDLAAARLAAVINQALGR